MKDILRLLSFHLRMLPCAVTIAYPFGGSRGLRTCIKPCKQERARAATGMHSLLLTKKNLQTKTKPLSKYQTAEYPHGRRSRTRTRSTQTCCLDIFTARPSPPHKLGMNTEILEPRFVLFIYSLPGTLKTVKLLKMNCKRCQEYGISCMDWLPSSPDLNPIENVRALLKARPRKR
jgi:hypothetical protein